MLPLAMSETINRSATAVFINDTRQTCGCWVLAGTHHGVHEPWQHVQDHLRHECSVFQVRTQGLDASRQRAWQAAKEVIASQVQGQEVSELLIPHLHIHIDRKVNAHVHINIHMQFIMLVDALTPSQL